MMNKEQKAVAVVYGIIYGIYGLGIGAELVAKKVKKVREEKNKKKTIEHADSEKLYMLAAEKSVGWWQQSIQDALDALDARSCYTPSRVVVTNAIARECRAYCLNKTPEVDGTGISYMTGITIRGLEIKVKSSSDWKKEYEVEFMLSFKKIEGTLVPYVEVLPIRSYLYNLEERNFKNYDDLIKKLDEEYNKAAAIVERGAVDREIHKVI